MAGNNNPPEPGAPKKGPRTNTPRQVGNKEGVKRKINLSAPNKTHSNVRGGVKCPCGCGIRGCVCPPGCPRCRRCPCRMKGAGCGKKHGGGKMTKRKIRVPGVGLRNVRKTLKVVDMFLLMDIENTLNKKYICLF